MNKRLGQTGACASQPQNGVTGTVAPLLKSGISQCERTTRTVVFQRAAGGLPGAAGGSSRQRPRGSPVAQLTKALGDPFFWPG